MKMIPCIKSLRDGECFCSRYDENRQTMFYCGFFTTVVGFIWFIIGFTIRCAFFAEAFGPSVDAVACGIMVVGLMILAIGLFSTISIVCTKKPNNKTSCVSSSMMNNQKHYHNQKHFDDTTTSTTKTTIPSTTTMEIDIYGQSTPTHYSPRTASFSSESINDTSMTTTSAISLSSSSSSSKNFHNKHYSYRTDIAMIA